MPIVKAGNWSLNVVEQGSGPTLLLIHGLAGDHTAWTPHIAAFSKDYRVVAFDNPGSGKSSAVSAPTSMRELAESVLRLMDAQKIESAHVVGRSMGGAMAQQLAVMAPERVRTLVLAASFAKLDPLGKRLLENMREVVQWGRSWTEWTRQFSHTFVSHDFFNQNQERMAQIEKLVGDESRDRTSYQNLCTAVIDTEQLDILGAIRCPTLIMAGRRDGICSPVATGWMQERLPKAEVVFFEKSSHFFLMEEAEKAMATLADWFEAARLNGMQFENTFIIPVAPEEAWPLLLDVPAIAPCLPGAEITETLGERKFRGRATVKVGPVQLAFAGEAEILDVDDAARTARVVARGADQKGRGNASASVTFSLAPDAAGSRVNVVTDLTLVGAVAQYGRGAGLLKLVADQIIGQFARNLEAALRAAAGEGDAAPMAGQPISGLRVLGGAIGAAIRNKWAAKQG